MRCLVDMDSIAIELTNACMNSCSNCTRFAGHTKPFFMTFDQFKQAIDSMENFPGVIGFLGGEPLLHPQFPEFCEYALSKFPREKLGLWSCFPAGKENYREIICKTFKHIFLNDHSRPDIFHCPILVAIEEVEPNPWKMFLHIDHCWLQNNWSASINPKGAFFCEVAASMAMLFDTDKGWVPEPDWFVRTPKDYIDQIEEYCPKCGVAAPLPRRSSLDGRDDISPGNLNRLRGRSLKIDRGQYILSDLKMNGCHELDPMAKYKDQDYRKEIANRYGIFLTLNELDYHEPHLKKAFDPERKTIFEQLQGKYREEQMAAAGPVRVR